jgi:betaine-aldehyde dehydrogenase
VVAQIGQAQRPGLRPAVLLDFADRLEAARPELARHLTAENGKLLKDAEHEINAGVSESRYYAGLARNIFGRVTKVDKGLYAMLAREPIGVAGIIVPWNAPVTLLVRSMASALAAGCTVVIKAAPQTALINEALFKVLAEVEALPPGVVNMINEVGSEAAKTLVASPEVDIISYTGSTQVGKQIMAGAAGTLKRLNLELGGSAPVVIFDDADLQLVVSTITRAGTVMAGQMCTAASRLLVHSSRLAELQQGLAGSLSAVVVGPGQDPKSEMGPMIDVPNRERIQGLVDEAEQTGQVVLRGQAPGGELANGAFIRPSLVAIRDSGSPLLKKELFGPVLTLDTFEDEDEAVHKANNTRYGLASSVWTGDLKRAQRVARRIQSGTVWINAHNRLFAEAETGGYKESGFGRLHGIEGLVAFLQTKHISWHTGE